jgi:hypothetical protein
MPGMAVAVWQRQKANPVFICPFIYQKTTAGESGQGCK